MTAIIGVIAYALRQERFPNEKNNNSSSSSSLLEEGTEELVQKKVDPTAIATTVRRLIDGNDVDAGFISTARDSGRNDNGSHSVSNIRTDRPSG